MTRELKVDLDFNCCTCGSCMSVTLKCAGIDLPGAEHALATVKVPCPTCSNINELYFQPNGTIHAVAPYLGTRRVPEPSVN